MGHSKVILLPKYQSFSIASIIIIIMPKTTVFHPQKSTSIDLPDLRENNNIFDSNIEIPT